MPEDASAIEQADAVEQALRALGSRDRTRGELDTRLAERGVDAAEREQALDTLARMGYLDDERVARARAEELARRGSGDALIRHDLVGRGVASELVEALLAELEPERDRAAKIAERRGRSAKTARYLASRGFQSDAVAALVAHDDREALGS